MDVVDSDEGALDPRIQIELENLNTATDEINRLEIELDEANTTFRILLNECTRRLKQKSKLLGSCVEKARPYYEALDVARQAQLECQRAAVQYQRANEIHQAAKETVALAEQRFLSKQHEWQFDNAWQEMLNHATIKVRDAETQKAESGREHHKRAMLFNAAEQKVQQLEQRLHRHIIKSRPYFEEKSLCNGQLAAQKERVETLQTQVSAVKNAYAASLKELERISEEIHCKRKGTKLIDRDMDPPCGPREPGVGAELTPVYSESGTTNEDPISKPSTHMENKSPNFNEEAEVQVKTFNEEKRNVLPNTSPKAPAITELSHEPHPSPSKTPLPLLESLAQFKQSNSCEMLKVHTNSPVRNLPCSERQVSLSSPESRESLDRDPSLMCVGHLDREENLSAGVCSPSLLTQLMENYVSELDQCDMASLGSASVATGSSAVSEKDENELQVEEDLEELREQIRELSTHPVVSKLSSTDCSNPKFAEPFSALAKKCYSANHTPRKTLASSMSLPSLLLSSNSGSMNHHLPESSEDFPLNSPFGSDMVSVVAWRK